MPVLSWGHSQYWQVQAPVTPPQDQGASADGGYITWMAPTTITYSGSLFGALQPVWEWIVTIRTKRPDGQL